MFIKQNTLHIKIISLLVLLFIVTVPSPTYSVPDDHAHEEVKLEKNSPMFWIWNENLELIEGSTDPDTQEIYLASLTKAYTLNRFLETEQTQVHIQFTTPYNYSKVKVGDTISHMDAITALLVRSCNTVAENMLGAPPKEGFISSSGLPLIVNGTRYENKDSPTNVLNAFVKNENIIEIYQRIYDGRYGHTTYRKWTAHNDLHFCYIKTGFTDLAGKCVFIKTKHHYFLFVGWDKHSELVKDSISMVRIYEEDHTEHDLRSLGEIYTKDRSK